MLIAFIGLADGQLPSFKNMCHISLAQISVSHYVKSKTHTDSKNIIYENILQLVRSVCMQHLAFLKFALVL